MQSQQSEERIEREDYLEAQRAAVEAVQIGRETLEETARQGEQLTHADRMADQTRYAIDKSGRILKGMTWSGWLSNIVSKNAVKPKEEEGTRPFTYNDVPTWAEAAAQAIQNYKANLMVLEACETKEQRDTCQMVCENMFSVASNEIAKAQVPEDGDTQVLKKMIEDLTRFRQRQKSAQRLGSPQQARSPQQSPNRPPTKSETIKSVQDEHLDVLSSNLDELNSMALSLNEMVGTHNKLMGTLDEKSDYNLEASKMVARRADRLAHKRVSTISVILLFSSHSLTFDD